MDNVPTSIINYLITFMVDNSSLAYLLIDKEGCLSAWGGKLTAYGITNLQKGKNIGQQVFFLEGLLPLDDLPLFLPWMKIDDSICTDLHLFPSDEGDWVLLLDATSSEMQIKIIQQQGQDDTLSEEKLTKIVKRSRV